MGGEQYIKSDPAIERYVELVVPIHYLYQEMPDALPWFFPLRPSKIRSLPLPLQLRTVALMREFCKQSCPVSAAL